MSLTDRRGLLAGLGATALMPVTFRPAAAQVVQSVTVQAKAEPVVLTPPAKGTGSVHRALASAWTLRGPGPILRFKRGGSLDIALRNDLPVPVALSLRGIDGAATSEPLASRPAVAAGTTANLSVALRHAGTSLCDVRLLADGTAQPSRPLPLVVQEQEAVPVDRDEVLLVEDWRLGTDGTVIAAGVDAGDAAIVFTVNGEIGPEIRTRPHERLRLRIINACQRAAIAIKVEGVEIRVMAMDGEPTEPFWARNGALVLAPGSRVDGFLDATTPAGSRAAILLSDGKEARPIAYLATANEPPLRPAPLPPAPPLPSNGLPERLDLKNAQRIDLPLSGPDWVRPTSFTASFEPAFRAKTGRTVVLALANRAPTATVFHLHGHHFRLLDRLDDGWKPFWLDTLAVEPGQTQRIAFAAEYAGRYLLESVATDWAAPRFVRWYEVA